MKKLFLFGVVALLVLGSTAIPETAFADVSDGIAYVQVADEAIVPGFPGEPLAQHFMLYALNEPTLIFQSKQPRKKHNGLSYSQLARARLRSVRHSV